MAADSAILDQLRQVGWHEDDDTRAIEMAHANSGVALAATYLKGVHGKLYACVGDKQRPYSGSYRVVRYGPTYVWRSGELREVSEWEG